jgi:hypothetical protein
MAQVQQQVAAYIPLYQQYLQEQKAIVQRELAQLQRSQTRQVDADLAQTVEDDQMPVQEETPTPETALEEDLDDDIGL